MKRTQLVNRLLKDHAKKTQKRVEDLPYIVYVSPFDRKFAEAMGEPDYTFDN